MDANTIPVSGQQLITDFQTVFASISMTASAEYEAQRSESALMSELASVSASSAYLQPGSIAGSGYQDDITRRSLDAHIKKVQAEQLKVLTNQQLQQLISEDQLTYHKRRVSVTPLNYADNAVESLWYDAHSGYRSGTVKRPRIIGTISEVLLDKNVLILRPTRQRLLFNRGLQHYVVYVINPETMAPMVSITLL